jgi:hypothetical protein
MELLPLAPDTPHFYATLRLYEELVEAVAAA